MSTYRELDREAWRLTRGENEGMWEGFEFGRPGRMAYYFQDFFAWTAAEWVVTETGTNTQAITDEHGGVLLLTNAAADNDLTSLQLGNTGDAATGESIACASGRVVFFETRLKISDATQSDFLAGLVVTDTTPLANANGIHFIKDDGDTQLDIVTTNTSVSTIQTNVFTVGTSYMKLGFKVTGLDKVEYWVNDVKVGTNSSQIPTTEIRPTFHIQNGEAVAKTMSIDYFVVAATR